MRADVYTPRLGRESGEYLRDYDAYIAAISPTNTADNTKNRMRLYS